MNIFFFVYLLIFHDDIIFITRKNVWKKQKLIEYLNYIILNPLKIFLIYVCIYLLKIDKKTSIFKHIVAEKMTHENV